MQVVKGAKQVLGESTVTLIRTKAIQKHSEVIAAFCESAESPVGKIALKQVGLSPPSSAVCGGG